MPDNLMFRNEIKEAQRVVSTSDFGKSLWRRLLATLIDNDSRIPEMRVHLDDSDVPEDLPMEKKLFGVLHLLNERNIPPTPDNVLNGLIVHGELAANVAEVFLKDILPERDTGNKAIESLSHFVAEDVKAQRNDQAWSVALGVIKGNKGTAQERQETAMNIVSAANKSEAAFEQGSDKDVTYDFYEWADARYQEFLDGNTNSGPILPWYGFTGNHGVIPAGVDYGDMTLITAGSGYGKSTVVGQIAEANAYDKQICDVLVILLETNLMKMKARSLARNCYIPYDMVKAKRFNRKDARFHKKTPDGSPAKHSLDWYEKWVLGSSCEINYAFAPGVSAYMVTSLMSLYRRKAEARGKSLLVIVDYLYKIDWRLHSYDERVGLAIVSDIIRDAIEIQNNKSPLHLIMMHQENDEGQPYGGKGVLQRSQMHISLQRTPRPTGESLGDAPITANGVAMVDAYGNPRYYHRSFDRHNSNAKFVVRKANDAPGAEVPVIFENAMYKIWNHPSEIRKHEEAGRS